MECFTIYANDLKGSLSPLFFISQPKNTKGFIELNKVAVINPSRKVENLNLTDLVPYIGLPETDDLEIKKILRRPYKEVKGRNIIKEGDILFARIEPSIFNKKYIFVGDLQGNKYAFTSTEFYIVKAKENINPKFLFYMFFTKDVFAQVLGRTTGSTGRRRLDKGVFENLLIPYPDERTQNHIVQIMDNAYNLKKSKETEAQKLLDSINDYVLSELGIKPPSEKKKMCFSVYSNEIEGRIDPSAYHPIRMNAIKAIKSSENKIYLLKNIVRFKRDIITSTNQNLPYIGLENIESNTGLFIESKEVKTSFGSAFKFNKGDILFPKLRPYLNKVHLAEFDGVCSTEFHVIESEKCNNLYLSAFLKSNLVVSQTSYLMTGNTLPRLQRIDVENLLIPVPSQNTQNKIAEEVKQRMEKAEQLQKEAKQILEKAKEEVENIILGEG